MGTVCMSQESVRLKETSVIPLIAGNKENLVVRVWNESGGGIRMTDGNDAHFRLH